MIRTNFDAPPVLAGTPDQKCQQLYRYLYALAEQLQNVLDSIETDSTDDLRKRVAELEKMRGITSRTTS